MSTDDVFREVDEEVRRDRLQLLWKRYGNYALAAVVAVVLTAAGIAGWREYQTRRNLAQATAFLAAIELAAKGREADARAAFAKLAAEADPGYAALARLREAGLRTKAGDAAGAWGIYRALAADTSLDPVFRDLAVILWALDAVDSADPAELQERLKPLAVDTNPWRYSARELTALAARRAGDAARAKEIYTGLADDLAAPASLRARANEMLAALGG